MVDHFKGGDFHQINGVLRTAHSLTKRYRHEFKSQELWKEIKIVLDTFAAPFTELFDGTLQLASQHAQNPPVLKVSLYSLSRNYHYLHVLDENFVRVHMYDHGENG